MPSIEEWNRQADQLGWLQQHGMDVGPQIRELPAWARGKVGGVAGIPGSVPGAGGAGTLQGAGPLPGTYNPASGGIPGTTDTGTSLTNLLGAISGQIGNLGPIIGGITNAQNAALRGQYPTDYFNTLGTIGQNIGERAKGNIADLLPIWNQQGAEWGIGKGVTNSPAFQSKLAKDVLGGAYNVQRQAIDDAAKYQNLIPKVDPYSPNRLIPDIGQQLNLQALADMLRAAPVPEAAYQRSRADALAGLNRGFNAGIGPSWGGGGVGNLGSSPQRSPLTFPQAAGGLPPNVATTPGWGMAWNPQGGFAAEGNVPIDVLNQEGFGPMNMVGPEWDQLFDLGIEEPFMEQEIFDAGEDWFDDAFFD